MDACHRAAGGGCTHTRGTVLCRVETVLCFDDFELVIIVIVDKCLLFSIDRDWIILLVAVFLAGKEIATIYIARGLVVTVNDFIIYNFYNC